MITDSKDQEFIKENYLDMTDPELASALGYSRNEIRSFRRVEDLIKYKKATWSKKEVEIIKNLYPDTPNDEILKQLDNKSREQLYKKASNLGVNKTDEFMLAQNKKLAENLQESGKSYRFEKGHVPASKGKKQEEFMSPEAIERTKATRFKKGRKPHNTKWDGAVTIREDSNGHNYMWIRHGENDWEMYNRHVYRKKIGPIPDGHIVVFKNGDTLDPRPENLEAITRQEHRDRNVDYEKSSQSLKEYYAKNEHPARDLTDTFVAGRLAGGDHEIREIIINEYPNLIRVARANMKLNREIRNNGTNNDSGND